VPQIVLQAAAAVARLQQLPKLALNATMQQAEAAEATKQMTMLLQPLPYPAVAGLAAAAAAAAAVNQWWSSAIMLMMAATLTAA
jgi:hypothetical protein